MDRRRKRRGAVVLEAMVAVPVMVIALLAIVEFGLLMSSQSCVQSASRAGADAATQIPLPVAGAVPDEILSAVQASLACKGVSSSCVRVEHNAGGGGPFVLESGVGTSAPSARAPTLRSYVTVSVCVDNTQLAPNLLETFCIDLSETFSQKSTTRCYP